jgi:hypothetical protein
MLFLECIGALKLSVFSIYISEYKNLGGGISEGMIEKLMSKITFPIKTKNPNTFQEVH